MSDGALLTPGELLARAGIATDVLTFWTRKNLMVPLNQGERGHKQRRLYAFYEANLAAVMRELRALGADIEALFSIAAIYRQAIAWANELGASHDDVFAMWTVFTHQAFRDRGDYADEEAYQAGLDRWRHERHGSQRVTPRIEAMAERAGWIGFQLHRDAFLCITDRPAPLSDGKEVHPNVTYFWRGR